MTSRKLKWQNQDTFQKNSKNYVNTKYILHSTVLKQGKFLHTAQFGFQPDFPSKTK